MAGTAYFGEGMTMLKKLINWLNTHKRFAELQKAHDARLMLNKRLSAENQELRKQVQRGKKPKTEAAMSSAAQRHITQMSDAHSLQKAKQHVALMRREVLIRRLALLIDADQYFTISDEVAAMRDAEVLSYKKPKLKATSNSN
jgi:regulator of replication initiation timing